MGFDSNRAQQALVTTHGNIEQAAELLLAEQERSSKSISSTSTVARSNTAMQRQHHQEGHVDEDDPQLQRILQESIQYEKTRSDPNVPPRTRVGLAALERAENASRRFGSHATKLKSSQKNSMKKGGTTGTLPALTRPKTSGTVNENHHELKIPTQLRTLTKEEQILRCSQRLAPHAFAVDTILKILKTIRDDPNNEKYRKIYKSNTGYQKALKDKPGADDLLMAVNFYVTVQDGSDILILARNMVDPALLYLAISALEKIKEESEEYKSSKAQDLFAKEISALLQTADCSEEEAIRRAAFLSQCPTESTGSGVILQVHLGHEQTISRRFDGDDVLTNVIHWLGAHSSSIPEKIASREWCLVNLNEFPAVPIDVDIHSNKTLQYLGCFPSARLELRPSSIEWKNGKVHESVKRQSRSLGITTIDLD